MANQPDENTVSTSFTLPRPLFAALSRRAKSEITNQSDIIRRALLNYLNPQERESVMREITGPASAQPESRPARYVIRARGRPANPSNPGIPSSGLTSEEEALLDAVGESDHHAPAPPSPKLPTAAPSVDKAAPAATASGGSTARRRALPGKARK